MRIEALTFALLLGVGIVGCDTESADQPAPEPEAAEEPAETAEPATGEMTEPDWFVVDDDAETVEIEMVAGSTGDNNYWNFHGLYGGEGLVVVPEGYEVTITLVNEDENMGHSIGVDELEDSYPTDFSEVEPVFEGAVTSNPTSMTESTLPGESEEISFTADEAGEYALVCYVTTHAAQGMYVPFEISADGEAGVVM